ncbi:MAG: DUF106 domain-containing protein [Nanoarchaeota archaeon]|nr:DUF106 domain-containing protein [Nanoarchaeota archaeon]
MGVVELINLYPLYSLAGISVIVTLISTILQKKLTDQEHLKHLKQRQKEIQKELKNCKDDCLMKELNSELLSLTGLMFKSSMKPIFVTIVPFILLFTWLRGIYTPIISGWIWWYLGFSMGSSIALRKIFNVA